MITAGWAEKDNGAWLVNSINYSNSSIDELLPSSYLPSGALGIRYNGGSEQCTGNGYGYACKIDGGLNRPVGTCSVVIWRPSTSSWVGAYEGCCAGNRFYRSAVSGGTGPSAGDIVILQTDVVDWADVQNWDPYDGPVTPPASSKIVFTGDIAGSNNQGWTTSAADYQITGTDDVDDNYMRLGSGGAEIRNNGTSMRFNFQVQPTSPDYASATAWKDAVNASTINLSGCFVKLDGVDYPVTGISVNEFSPSIFFQMASSDVTAFFAAIQAGSTYEFAIDWQ